MCVLLALTIFLSPYFYTCSLPQLKTTLQPTTGSSHKSPTPSHSLTVSVCVCNGDLSQRTCSKLVNLVCACCVVDFKKKKSFVPALCMHLFVMSSAQLSSHSRQINHFRKDCCYNKLVKIKILSWQQCILKSEFSKRTYSVRMCRVFVCIVCNRSCILTCLEWSDHNWWIRA